MLQFPSAATANRKCAFLIKVDSAKWITFTCNNVDETSFKSLIAYPTVRSSSGDDGSVDIGAKPLPKATSFQGSMYVEFEGGASGARLDCNWKTTAEKPSLIRSFAY